MLRTQEKADLPQKKFKPNSMVSFDSKDRELFQQQSVSDSEVKAEQSLSAALNVDSLVPFSFSSRVNIHNIHRNTGSLSEKVLQ